MQTELLAARTLIVGAGLTGSWLAATLARAGHPVQVVDKGRGPGGRLSQRRTDLGSFAHGCPSDRVAEWLAGLPPALRGALDPEGGLGQRVLPRHLLTGIEARFGASVARIERTGTTWQLWDAQDSLLAEAERLVLTAPAPQSAALLKAWQPQWAARLQALRLTPAWSLLLARQRESAAPDWSLAADLLDGVEVQATDDAGDTAVQRWVLRLSDAASERHLEDPPPVLLQSVLDRFGGDDGRWLCASAHRWRYARVRDPLPEPLLYCADTALAVCGDAFAGSVGDCDLERCRQSAHALLKLWLPEPGR